MTRLRDRFSSLQRGPRERVRLWRMHYFIDACRLMQFATVLEMRCGDRMAAPKRRAIKRFLRAERSALPVPGLFARGARELARRRPETLGAEWMLAYAFSWRRLVAATARDRPQESLRIDALPPALAPRPRARLPGDPDLRAVAQQIEPLRLAVRDSAPQRVNVLVPTLESAAALQLARRLAGRGVRVRVITVDPSGPVPRAQARALAPVELEYGRESLGVEISRADTFVATTWWTAHIARAALREVEAERFLYLIEEYAPLAMPPGSLAALAIESYRFPHAGLYASEMLHDYFRAHRIAADDAVVFEPAVKVSGPRRAGGRRALLFDAGSMFELGILALSRALELGAFARDWDLHGVGITRTPRRIDLGGGDWLELVGDADYGRYDVGLALLHAPQPGAAPIAMAAAGMLAVTNTFESKTAGALAAISPNLVAGEPTVEGLARALCVAADRAGEARDSAVHWSRSWDESFDDALLDRVSALLA